jgi:Leucine-rich repeat (LRR) protein
MLQSLEPSFLASLPSLQILKVSENKLTKLQMPSTLFQLTNLNMAGNQLVKIEADSLLGLDALTHLNLRDNQLQSIHSATFRNQ